VIGGATVRGQQDEREEFVVIKAARVITISGPELRNADILLADGKIRLVGSNISYPKSARVIDARQQVVMPGMIHPHTRWQLPSYSRSGVHADRAAAAEVFLSEIDFEPWVQAGYTLACFYPLGSGISGTSSIYRVAGQQETRAIGDGYVRISMSSPGSDKKTLRGAVKKARSEIEKVEKARKAWEEKQKKAQEEASKQPKEEADKEEEKTPPEKKEPKAADGGEKEGNEGETKEGEQKKERQPETFTPPKIDPAVLPLVNWIRDKKGPPLLYELRSAAQLLHLQDALKEAEELPVARLYLSDAVRSDFHHVTGQLGELQATIVVPVGIGTLPYTSTRYNLAAELLLAGCRLALVPGRDSASVLKEYRTDLADLVRAGVPRDEVLKAVTLRCAEVLGIEKRFGTIENGKQADLIFLDGDPLHPDTQVRRVMTAGQIVWEANSDQ
jgi:hypothetical protein